MRFPARAIGLCIALLMALVVLAAEISLWRVARGTHGPDLSTLLPMILVPVLGLIVILRLGGRLGLWGRRAAPPQETVRWRPGMRKHEDGSWR